MNRITAHLSVTFLVLTMSGAIPAAAIPDRIETPQIAQSTLDPEDADKNLQTWYCLASFGFESRPEGWETVDWNTHPQVGTYIDSGRMVL